VTEDRAASEAAHCWGVRISFNTCSHKMSGLRSPFLASAMSFVAIACLTQSSQSPVRRPMQIASNATPKMRVPSKSNRSPSRNGVIGVALLPGNRRERDRSLSHRCLGRAAAGGCSASHDRAQGCVGKRTDRALFLPS
jgi:hypothetical protein